MVEIAMSLLEDVSNLLKFHAKNIQKSWLSGGIHIFKSKKSAKKHSKKHKTSLLFLGQVTSLIHLTQQS